MIQTLRERLKEIEDEGRFGGRAYPNGVEPFPRLLVGQGFFPGGDGLWRDSDLPHKLREPSPYAFPKNGIMFLGNDFGTLQSYNKLKLHENPPTWRHLRHRLVLANIPGQVGFYTNAFLGLRSDRGALATSVDNPTYLLLCAEYLGFQISVQEPRLVVVLGASPAGLLERILAISAKSRELQFGNHRGRQLGVLIVSHPYSDLNKSSQQKEELANRTRDAWFRVS